MSCSHGSKGGELWWEQINPAAKTNKIRENIKEELATEKDDETYLPRISSSSSSSSNLSILLASHWVVEPCGIPLLDASTTWLCYNWSWTWENAIKIWYCRLAVANMCKQSLGTWKSKAGETISVQAVNTTEWLDTLQPCISLKWYYMLEIKITNSPLAVLLQQHIEIKIITDYQCMCQLCCSYIL